MLRVWFLCGQEWPYGNRTRSAEYHWSLNVPEQELKMTTEPTETTAPNAAYVYPQPDPIADRPQPVVRPWKGEYLGTVREDGRIYLLTGVTRLGRILEIVPGEPTFTAAALVRFTIITVEIAEWGKMRKIFLATHVRPERTEEEIQATLAITGVDVTPSVIDTNGAGPDMATPAAITALEITEDDRPDRQDEPPAPVAVDTPPVEEEIIAEQPAPPPADPHPLWRDERYGTLLRELDHIRPLAYYRLESEFRVGIVASLEPDHALVRIEGIENPVPAPFAFVLGMRPFEAEARVQVILGKGLTDETAELTVAYAMATINEQGQLASMEDLKNKALVGRLMMHNGRRIFRTRFGGVTYHVRAVNELQSDIYRLAEPAYGPVWFAVTFRGSLANVMQFEPFTRITGVEEVTVTKGNNEVPGVKISYVTYTRGDADEFTTPREVTILHKEDWVETLIRMDEITQKRRPESGAEQFRTMLAEAIGNLPRRREAMRREQVSKVRERERVIARKRDFQKQADTRKKGWRLENNTVYASDGMKLIELDFAGTEPVETLIARVDQAELEHVEAAEHLDEQTAEQAAEIVA